MPFRDNAKKLFINKGEFSELWKTLSAMFKNTFIFLLSSCYGSNIWKGCSLCSAWQKCAFSFSQFTQVILIVQVFFPEMVFIMFNLSCMFCLVMGKLPSTLFGISSVITNFLGEHSESKKAHPISKSSLSAQHLMPPPGSALLYCPLGLVVASCTSSRRGDTW